jgi:hypothetical protein
MQQKIQSRAILTFLHGTGSMGDETNTTATAIAAVTTAPNGAATRHIVDRSCSRRPLSIALLSRKGYWLTSALGCNRQKAGQEKKRGKRRQSQQKEASQL